MSPAVRAKILIVDDRPENLVTLEAVLSRPDQDLVKASSGREALRHLLYEDFAVILMDVQMPELDGFETAALIKMRERCRDTPIIFITANHKEDSFIFRGYQAGAVDYVFKPFDPHTLRAKVAVFVDLFRKRHSMQIETLREHSREVARIESANELRYRTLADAIPQLLWKAAPDGNVEYVNRVWTRTTGLGSDASRGSGWQSVIHAEDLPRFLEAWGDAVPYERAFEVECRIREIAKLGDGHLPRYAWYLIKAVPERDTQGEPVAWIVSGTHIDDRKHEEERARFLATAGASLAESLDLADTLQNLSALAVPRLGDWCAIHLVDGNLVPSLAELSHPDPMKAESIRRGLAELGNDAILGPARTIASGRAHLVSEQDCHPAQARWLASLGLRALICVPLKARKRMMGTLTLASDARGYGPGDLRLVEDLGAHAALAIANAVLYDDAQRAIRARDEFLSIASHELKTPLTPLKIQTQTFRMLADRGTLATLPPQKLARMLETSDRQVEKLSSLIEEMLDISRIHIGKLVQNFETFDLRTLVLEVAERFAGELDHSGCALALEMPGDVTVRWDKFRVEQILVNLMSNAIKYGPGRPVRIAASERDGVVRLSVRDQGIGIEKKDQPRIFERFERAVSARHFGGLGLGLYISRQIAIAHGGSIEVSSEPGNGAEFVVHLPKVAGSETRVESALDGGIGETIVASSRNDASA